MKTGHGDKKREIIWGIPKATLAAIVPVLKERNAQQSVQQQLQQYPPPVTTCSDSHLYIPKEVSIECEASVEAIDIDQGECKDLVLIESRQKHCDIVDMFMVKHGHDYFPFFPLEELRARTR